MKYGGKCAYCGDISSDNMSIDHMIPRSRGGSNCESNLMPSCRSCNSTKGTKTVEEFILYMDYIDLVREYGFTLKQLQFLVKNTSFTKDYPRGKYVPYFEKKKAEIN